MDAAAGAPMDGFTASSRTNPESTGGGGPLGVVSLLTGEVKNHPLMRRQSARPTSRAFVARSNRSRLVLTMPSVKRVRFE
ncbi:MAG: hypothetical protein K0R70_958 [Steroidobacteraceae bacterium]|nr:hypothetical protein [Steroidobacteraceae bacterium]